MQWAQFETLSDAIDFMGILWRLNLFKISNDHTVNHSL